MELLREAPLRAVQRPVTTDEMLLAEQLARQLAICKTLCEQDVREGAGEGRQLILKTTPLNKIKAAQSATSLQDHLSEQLREFHKERPQRHLLLR